MASHEDDSQKLEDVIHLEKSADDIPMAEPTSRGDIPSGYFPVTAEEKAMSRALNRKLDIFLLPFLSLLYLFNGLDRGNVGNAETQG
jgi:hypothetical protein